MFQAWPVKIMTMAAASMPTLEPGKRATSERTSPGMKPSTGTLCSTSSSGTSTRSASASRAAQ